MDKGTMSKDIHLNDHVSYILRKMLGTKCNGLTKHTNDRIADPDVVS